MDANERRMRASHEAAQWWHRLTIEQPDEVSRADRERFTHWLRESPLHVAELLRIAHVHDALEHFKGWGEIEIADGAGPANVIALHDAIAPAPGNASSQGMGPAAASPRHWQRWAVAASVCCLAIAAVWIMSLRSEVLDTGLAERRQIMLEDGSIVRLEPQTRLRVQLETHRRFVELERGRALFRVAKDTERPFWVSADAVSIRAVGTEFGVEAGDRVVVVTVAEGSVAVTRAGAAPLMEIVPETASGSGAIAQTPSAEVLLGAGQQLTMQSIGAIGPVRSVDTTRALAWSRGQLVFENDTLGDVVAEFNRYNRTQLRIDDPSLASRRVSGVFEATDVDTLLAFISQSGTGVRITRAGSNVLIGAGNASAAPDASIR